MRKYILFRQFVSSLTENKLLPAAGVLSALTSDSSESWQLQGCITVSKSLIQKRNLKSQCTRMFLTPSSWELLQYRFPQRLQSVAKVHATKKWIQWNVSNLINLTAEYCGPEPSSHSVFTNKYILTQTIVLLDKTKTTISLSYRIVWVGRDL